MCVSGSHQADQVSTPFTLSLSFSLCFGENLPIGFMEGSCFFFTRDLLYACSRRCGVSCSVKNCVLVRRTVVVVVVERISATLLAIGNNRTNDDKVWKESCVALKISPRTPTHTHTLSLSFDDSYGDRMMKRTSPADISRIQQCLQASHGNGCDVCVRCEHLSQHP